MGLAHVAQPSYLALTNFGEVSTRATIRCCVRCWGPFGLAQLLGGERRSRGDRPTGDPRFCPNSLGGGGRGATALPADGDGTPSLPFRSRGTRDPTMRSRRGATLPWFRADGGLLFAARTRYKKPYPRCQRAILRSPSQFLPKGTRKSIPHSPAQRKRDFGKLKFRGRMGVRRRGVPCRRLEGGFPS